MKFELKLSNRGASDEDLVTDLKLCAAKLGTDTISTRDYQLVGRYHERTYAKRFGSWSNALLRAGLKLSRSPLASKIADNELFDNIRTLWIRLGRQPQYREFARPASKYSAKIYKSRFGTIQAALKSFVEWSESAEFGTYETSTSDETTLAESSKLLPVTMRRTRRDVTDRQRFRILLRNGFRCQSCGSSPLRDSDVQLHVDHI